MTTLHPDIRLHGGGRVSEGDAERQRKTAIEILQRLQSQPGIILADEVGMGKTFVALSVAVSVAVCQEGGGPVVVMVPPSLKEKWPRDFQYFRERCLSARLRTEVRDATAESAVELLKLLDDPPERRSNILFVTHGAMSRGLSDRWVKLGLIWRALKGRHHTADVRQRLDRGLGRILRCSGEGLDDQGFWLRLLERHPSTWRPVLNRWDPQVTDDPVPEAVWRTLEDLPTARTDALFATLEHIPRNRTATWNARLDEARSVLQEELRPLWIECLGRVRHSIRLPLLILDEAHHLKNRQTRLGSLFHDPEAVDDARELGKGSLVGVFARMLFLTATPFQLGHEELVAVLERFDGTSWCAGNVEDGQAFREQIAGLRQALNNAQLAAAALDQAWGRLRPEDLIVGGATYTDAPSWWPEAIREGSTLTAGARNALERFDVVRRAMREAEDKLRPWVIRHLKPRVLPRPHDHVLRRVRSVDGKDGGGILVPQDAVLPFLLAARAACDTPTSRPVFAEGLASSYEAFLETRLRNRGEGDLLDTDDDPVEFAASPANWYLDRLQELIPHGNSEASERHPKVDFTVRQVMDLWQRGEKLLVFCHFIVTGRALRRAISRGLRRAINELAAAKLGCSVEAASEELERIGDRFFDVDAPLRRTLDETVGSIVREYPLLVEENRTAAISEIVRRNFRTPSFLARFLPLGADLKADDVLSRALNTADGSGVTPLSAVRSFLGFLVAYASRLERDRYLVALRHIQVGSHRVTEARASFLDDEVTEEGTETILPNVRLVNGSTKPETRQRLMLAFNTPFYPEVLIASSVLAEGVDLQLNCRHVIHHDLCWNPSTLEQRTGRIDRIGAKAEQCGRSIQVFTPFLAETQDEKQYRVVMDRERWFQVVMGESYTPDLTTTEELAGRVEFPEAAAHDLAFRLEVE